jgi:flagellar biosynthetic protein FliR
MLAMVAARIAGMVMFMPMIGGLSVPARLRALFVFALAVLITPLVPVPEVLPTNVAAIALAVAAELMLGALMGLALRAVFTGLEIGGLLIAQQAGLAFGQIADPTTGVESSLLSSFYVQIGSMVFLVLGGHRVLIAAALDTFNTIPLLRDHGSFLNGVELLMEAITVGASVAVRVSAPVVLTLFLVNVALAFVGRTVPQLNIITVGFPIKGLAAMVLIAASLPASMEVFTIALDEVAGWVGAFTGG